MSFELYGALNYAKTLKLYFSRPTQVRNQLSFWAKLSGSTCWKVPEVQQESVALTPLFSSTELEQPAREPKGQPWWRVGRGKEFSRKKII